MYSFCSKLFNTKNSQEKKINKKCQYLAIKASIKYCVFTLILGLRQFIFQRLEELSNSQIISENNVIT